MSALPALHRAIEQFNAHDLDAYMELYADDVELHGYPPGVEGKEGARSFYAQFHTAFPDTHLQLFETLEDGDLVATRYVVGGTHEREIMGVPPTGRRVEVGGMTIMRFRDGKIVDRWQAMDMLGLLTQLGAVPAPA